MSRILPAIGKPVKPPTPLIGSLLTNGTHMLNGMDYIDPRAILAANLKALMQYAKEHPDSGPTSAAALERATELAHADGGVSDSAFSRYLNQEASAHLDHLAKIALAYDLQVWQLLYPSLEPANPPVLRQGPVEEELYRVLAAGAKLFAQQGAVDVTREIQTRASDSSHADRPLSGKDTAKRHKA